MLRAVQSTTAGAKHLRGIGRRWRTLATNATQPPPPPPHASPPAAAATASRPQKPATTRRWSRLLVWPVLGAASVGVGLAGACHNSPEVDEAVRDVLPAELRGYWSAAVGLYAQAADAARAALDARPAQPAPTTAVKAVPVTAQPPLVAMPLPDDADLQSLDDVAVYLAEAVHRLQLLTSLMSNETTTDDAVLAETQRLLAHLDARLFLVRQRAMQESQQLASTLDTQLKQAQDEAGGVAAAAELKLQQALAEQSAALQQKSAEELEQQRRQLADQNAAELAKQARILHAEWHGRLQQQLDEERHGRLAQLQQLSARLHTLEHRLGDMTHLVTDAHKQRRQWADFCQLVASLEQGEPSEAAVQRLVEQCGTDSLVGRVLSAIPAAVWRTEGDTGVKTLPQLRAAFPRVASDVRRVSFMWDDGGLEQLLVSTALSALSFARHGQLDSEIIDDGGDNDVEALLARAEAALFSDGDVDTAVRQLGRLEGAWSSWVAEPWLQQARTHLLVRQSLAAVQAHLAVQQLA